MEFERSESGLLLPEQPMERIKEPSRLATVFNSVGLSTVVNALMVLIQLITVWILWKTYQDTVIPNRQKELLSEQVANLEMEQTRRTAEVSLAKRQAQALNAELTGQKAELRQLAIDKQSLLSDVALADEGLKQAQAAEGSAKNSAAIARAGLEASQWSIYNLSASTLVGLPRMIMIGKVGEVERAGMFSDDPKAAFHTYLQSIEMIWPDMGRDAKMIVDELKKDAGGQYQRWMVEEFAEYFSEKSRGMSCPKPDFISIERDFDNRFDVAAAEAVKEVMEERSARKRSVDEALKRGVDVRLSEGYEQQTMKVAISNATYQMVQKIQEDLSEQIAKCNDQFEPIADAFFARKKATPLVIPRRVVEEWNRGASTP